MGKGPIFLLEKALRNDNPGIPIIPLRRCEKYPPEPTDSEAAESDGRAGADQNKVVLRDSVE